MMRGLIVVLTVLATLVVTSPELIAATQVTPGTGKRSESLQAIETNLLSLFGFQRRPRPDRLGAVIPSAMMHLYQEHSDQDIDTAALPLPGKHTATANTVRTFTHRASAIDNRFPTTSHRFRLSFDVTSIPREERLTASELQLSSEVVDRLGAGSESGSGSGSGPAYQRVDVHDIVLPGIRGQREPILRLIDSRLVATQSRESVVFDVMPAVLRWLETNTKNYGLLVEVSSLNGDKLIPKHIRLRRALDETLSAWLPKQPLLFTYTDDGKNVQRKVDAIVSRSKRSSLKGLQSKKTKQKKENCRRHPLYVDFADVGWNDWIVAPPGYEAYFCHGDCPFPLADHLNSTNHAIVQTLVNSVSPAAVPKACCVPTHLTSISMLYLDEESKVVLKNYQDMAVLGCGCR